MDPAAITGDMIMTSLFSSLAGQFGLGLAAFLVSGICILTASGPALLVG